MAITRLHVYPVSRSRNLLINELNKFVEYVRKGNDLVIVFTFVNAAGAAQDVSAYTTRNFRLGMATPVTGTPAFVTDGTNGQVSVTLTDAQLTTAGSYALEVQVSNGSSIKYTPVMATLVVQESYA